LQAHAHSAQATVLKGHCLAPSGGFVCLKNGRTLISWSRAPIGDVISLDPGISTFGPAPQQPSGRPVVAAIAAMLSVASTIVHAQETKKSYRIGVLERQASKASATKFDEFRRAMRGLGYVEGQNLRIEYRFLRRT